MKYVVEIPCRECKAGGVADQPVELRAGRQMRDFFAKARGISAKDRGPDLSAEPIIGGSDAFQQPFAIKPGAAGDEESRSAKTAPQFGGVSEDMVPVRIRNGRQGGDQNPTPRNSRMRSAA